MWPIPCNKACTSSHMCRRISVERVYAVVPGFEKGTAKQCVPILLANVHSLSHALEKAHFMHVWCFDSAHENTCDGCSLYVSRGSNSPSAVWVLFVALMSQPYTPPFVIATPL